MLKEFKNRKEELEKTSQKKTKKGVATKEALIAQEKLFSERFFVRKNLYDDYTGNPLDDDSEIEALSDLIESIKYFTSRY